MKRDMDVVRHILFRVEELTPSSVQEGQLVTDDWDADVISYHAVLMIDAGLLEGKPIRTMGSQTARVIITGLTWEGHDFLDAIRDDTVWSKTKSKVVETAGSVSLEVLKAVAVSVSRTMLGLPPA